MAQDIMINTMRITAVPLKRDCRSSLSLVRSRCVNKTLVWSSPIFQLLSIVSTDYGRRRAAVLSSASVWTWTMWLWVTTVSQYPPFLFTCQFTTSRFAEFFHYRCSSRDFRCLVNFIGRKVHMDVEPNVGVSRHIGIQLHCRSANYPSKNERTDCDSAQSRTNTYASYCCDHNNSTKGRGHCPPQYSMLMKKYLLFFSDT